MEEGYAEGQRVEESSTRPSSAIESSSGLSDDRARAVSEPRPVPGPIVPPCRGVDPQLFFPPKGRDYAGARTICCVCPVFAECRAYVDGSNLPGETHDTACTRANPPRSDKPGAKGGKPGAGHLTA